MTIQQISDEKKPTGKPVGFFNMAHSGGFEPPTARFVAEYSIQLSYECVVGAHYRAFENPVKHYIPLRIKN